MRVDLEGKTTKTTMKNMIRERRKGHGRWMDSLNTGLHANSGAFFLDLQIYIISLREMPRLGGRAPLVARRV